VKRNKNGIWETAGLLWKQKGNQSPEISTVKIQFMKNNNNNTPPPPPATPRTITILLLVACI
jgi:hypothetical protein